MKRVKELENKAVYTYEWNYGTKGEGFELQHDWNQTLVTKINEAAHVVRVNKKNVNKDDKDFYPLVLITSPEGLSVIDDLEYFWIDTTNEASDLSLTERVGFISPTGEEKDARYLIYRNPYMKADTVIVAQKDDLESEKIKEDCVTSLLKITGLPISYK